jgi:hypothetical protein
VQHVHAFPCFPSALELCRGIQHLDEAGVEVDLGRESVDIATRLAEPLDKIGATVS